ncbi:hypothetical protein D3C76_776800 [compost metagenome]
MHALHGDGGPAILIEAVLVAAQCRAQVFPGAGGQAMGLHQLRQLLEGLPAGIERRLTNAGELLQGFESIGRHQALLIGNFDMPGKGLGQVQEPVLTGLLALATHVLQCLVRDLIDQLGQALFGTLHGLLACLAQGHGLL